MSLQAVYSLPFCVTWRLVSSDIKFKPCCCTIRCINMRLVFRLMPLSKCILREKIECWINAWIQPCMVIPMCNVNLETNCWVSGEEPFRISGVSFIMQRFCCVSAEIKSGQAFLCYATKFHSRVIIITAERIHTYRYASTCNSSMHQFILQYQTTP